MRFTVIVAARSGSRRLPGKALLPFDGRPMLGYLLERLLPSKRAAKVVLATTTKPEDNALAAVADSLGVPVFRGNENDLVARYAGACATFGVDIAVRVTGDCPFVDAATLDYCLEACEDNPGFHLASTKGVFPVGIDYEIFPAAFLDDLSRRPDLNALHREHLTLYAYDRSEQFRIHRLKPPAGLPATNRSFTVDTVEDYDRCATLAQHLTGRPFTLLDLLEADAALSGPPSRGGLDRHAGDLDETCSRASRSGPDHNKDRAS